MRSFILDASVLVKRFTPEKGSALMDHLLATAPKERLACLLLGLGEVIFALVRKRNKGEITKETFHCAMVAFTSEVVDVAAFEKIQARREQIIESWSLIEKHSVNTSDVLLLRVALDHAHEQRPMGHDVVLVASDQRLLAAASAEGIDTLDPETDLQARLGAFFAEPEPPAGALPWGGTT